MRGRGETYERRFLRRALAGGLRVELPAALASPRAQRTWERVLASLAPGLLRLRA